MTIIARIAKSREISLKEAAELIRRAGLEHLVYGEPGEPLTSHEIDAMAEAGDDLDMERINFLVWSIQNPGASRAKFDGGATLRAETRALAIAASEAEKHGH